MLILCAVPDAEDIHDFLRRDAIRDDIGQLRDYKLSRSRLAADSAA
jgi:hypothetical protein